MHCAHAHSPLFLQSQRHALPHFLKCNPDAIHQCSAHGSTHKTVLLSRDVPSPLWPRSNTPLGCPILIVIPPELCLFPRLSKGQPEVCTPSLMGARSLLTAPAVAENSVPLHLSLPCSLPSSRLSPLLCLLSFSALQMTLRS